MSRRARIFSPALIRIGLAPIGLFCIGLGVVAFSGPGSAQDTAVNQAGAGVPAAAAPATAPVSPSLVVAPPPESAPTVAPPASPDQDALADTTSKNESSIDNTEADEPPAPLVRPRYTTAVLQALDKVTAETLRFEAKVGEPVRYKDLVITVHDCETNAANEAPKDSIVHMDVQYQPAVLSGGAAAVRQVFRGWMFADSPGLHPFVSAIYDVWVIACKTPTSAAGEPAESTPGKGASL